MAGGPVPRAAVLAGLLLLLGTAPLAAQVDSCGHSGGQQPLESDDVSTANRFIEAVRDADIARLASIIDFPLRRPYPLPHLSHSEFIARYEDIFDDRFTRMVVSSSADDCGRIGWRGLQLHDGRIWFDDDGHVISVNYESEVERRERMRLIELEKRGLHESLRVYDAPILEWETCTYRIRIDSMVNDDYTLRYRYASWKVERFHDSMPDIIIDNGSMIRQGTGGNHHYEFQNGDYRYVLYVERIGKGDSPGGLTVYRDRNMLSETIVNIGTESRYQALQRRLRMCSYDSES